MVCTADTFFGAGPVPSIVYVLGSLSSFLLKLDITFLLFIIIFLFGFHGSFEFVEFVWFVIMQTINKSILLIALLFSAVSSTECLTGFSF